MEGERRARLHPRVDAQARKKVQGALGMLSRSAEKRRIDDLVRRTKRIQAVRNTAWQGKLKGPGTASLEWKGCAEAWQEPAKQEKGKHLFSMSVADTERREAFNSRETQVLGEAFKSGWCSTEQVTRRMVQPELVKQILRNDPGGGDPTVCHWGGLNDLLRSHPSHFLRCCN